MTNHAPMLQTVLYRVFLVTWLSAAFLILLAIWGFVPHGAAETLFVRVVGTCLVVAVVAAFWMSANRLVRGKAPEDDRG